MHEDDQGNQATDSDLEWGLMTLRQDLAAMEALTTITVLTDGKYTTVVGFVGIKPVYTGCFTHES